MHQVVQFIPLKYTAKNSSRKEEREGIKSNQLIVQKEWKIQKHTIREDISMKANKQFKTARTITILFKSDDEVISKYKMQMLRYCQVIMEMRSEKVNCISMYIVQ